METRKVENSEFDPGKLVADRYLIVETLGAGGMGLVVKALDTKNFELPVVIKVLLDTISDKWSADKFNEERRALAKLQQCVEIVNLMDHGQTPNGRKYTVLEFIEGRPLSKIIPDLPNNLPRVTILFQQIANGVGFAHQTQIYHRDLKPDNIMVKNPGEKGELIKVLDFGIAKQTAAPNSDVEITTNIVGSPYYMAPNIFDGYSQPIEDDIYALGLIAFEMVTGQYPANFKDPHKKFSFTDLRNMQENIRLYPPSNQNSVLSEEIDRVILKALEPDPVNRFHSVEEFEKNLTHALNGITKFNDQTEPIPVNKDYSAPESAPTETSIPEDILYSKVEEKTKVKEKKKLNPVMWIPIVGGAGLVLGLVILLLIFGLGRKTEVAANTNPQRTEPQNLPNKREVSNPSNLGSGTNSNVNSANTTVTPAANLSSNSTNGNSSSRPLISPDDFTVAVDKKEKDNQISPAGFDQIFKAGDGIRLNVYSDKPGLLQIFWKESNGKTQRVHSGKIEPNKSFSFPSPQWIFFDEKPGTEMIYVVISESNSAEKIEVDLLEAQSNGKTRFNTEKGAAVQIVKLNHEK